MKKIYNEKTWEELSDEEKSKYHSLTDEEIDELKEQEKK